MSGWLDRHSLKLLVIAVALLICVPTWLVWSYTTKVDDLARENQKLARKVDAKVTSLQSAIVESCRDNGNARAKVARETLNEEITEAQNPDRELVAALGIPPAKLTELIEAEVAKLEDRLDRVKLTPCADQYQISPGSGDRRRSR
jgi:hypothetical protein